MEPLVSRNELVGKAQSRHQPALLEPKDRAKGPAEKDALYGGKGDESLAQASLGPRNPSKSPLGLFRDSRNRLDGVKEARALAGVPHESVDQKRINLAVDVFHRNLKAIKAARLGDLDLLVKVCSQVFVDDAVRGRKKS